MMLLYTKEMITGGTGCRVVVVCTKIFMLCTPYGERGMLVDFDVVLYATGALSLRS